MATKRVSIDRILQQNIIVCPGISRQKNRQLKLKYILVCYKKKVEMLTCLRQLQDCVLMLYCFKTLFSKFCFEYTYIFLPQI